MADKWRQKLLACMLIITQVPLSGCRSTARREGGALGAPGTETSERDGAGTVVGAVHLTDITPESLAHLMPVESPANELFLVSRIESAEAVNASFPLEKGDTSYNLVEVFKMLPDENTPIVLVTEGESEDDLGLMEDGEMAAIGGVVGAVAAVGLLAFLAKSSFGSHKALDSKPTQKPIGDLDGATQKPIGDLDGPKQKPIGDLDGPKQKPIGDLAADRAGLPASPGLPPPPQGKVLSPETSEGVQQASTIGLPGSRQANSNVRQAVQDGLGGGRLKVVRVQRNTWQATGTGLKTHTWDGVEGLARGLKKNAFEAKKAHIFNKSLEYYKAIPDSAKRSMRVFRFDDVDQFRLTSTQIPAYFKDSPNLGEIKVGSKSGFYGYDFDDPQVDAYHVDFANQRLGGGFTRDHAFVQEEIMFTEIPQLANYALRKADPDGRSGLRVRDDSGTVVPEHRDRVLQGSPQPLIFRDVQRVASFNTGNLYGSKFSKASLDDVIKEANAEFKALPTPQSVNVIAIAAPKLSPKASKTDKVASDTLTDVFNTSYAGFAGAVRSSPGRPVHIATGPLGAGVFNNDALAVNVMQQLAARHAQVKSIEFYSYKPEMQAQADAIVAKVIAEQPGSVSDMIRLASKFLKEGS